jgi:RimJ/RimL family protein N-acetyltransferase
LLRDYIHAAGFGRWAAIEKATGAFVGWFALRRPDGGSPDEAELVYRLRRSAWSRGFATEGSRVVIRKAFTELGVRRVFAQTMAVNQRSRRVMEKTGLTLVRAFFLAFDDPTPLRDGDFPEATQPGQNYQPMPLTTSSTLMPSAPWQRCA